MKIEKKSIGGKPYIELNGDCMTIKNASDATGIGSTRLRNICNRFEGAKLQREFEDSLWKVKHNITTNGSVFHVEGRRVTAEMIAGIIGCSSKTASNRINRAVKLGQTYEHMIRPVNKRYSERVKKYNANGNTLSLISGMQPRREPWELKPVGSWEKENLNPSNVPINNTASFAVNHGEHRR